MTRAKDIDVSAGEYYHLYTRGVGKKNIFLDNRDYARFLFCLLYFQYNESFNNISGAVTRFLSSGSFTYQKRGDPDEENREVEIVAFVLMPNHIHITALELKDGGIARLMKRALGGYAKYFNTKYKVSGHLFQGAYNAVHIKDNTQLLHVSAYLHRNPRELRTWKNKEDQYRWSSFSDFVKKNRWGNLIKPEIILNQFLKKSEYHDFVNESTAKEKTKDPTKFEV
ncbi:MAG: transposase [Parcubacteria group bacterium]|nr:transposase [Parcubacteria group bacterium]MCR4342927.1 transposase [Patescibacteria group bacterium]